MNVEDVLRPGTLPRQLKKEAGQVLGALSRAEPGLYPLLGLGRPCAFATAPSLVELALADPEQRFRKATLPFNLRWIVGDGTAASGLPAAAEAPWDEARAAKRAAILPALAPPSLEIVRNEVEPELALKPGAPFDAYALFYEVFFGLAWRLLFGREQSAEVMRACRGLRASAFAASQALRGGHSRYAPYLDRSLRADLGLWRLLPGSRRTALLIRRQSLGVLIREMLRGGAQDASGPDLPASIREWAQHLDGVDAEAAERFACVGLLLASFENSASVAAWLLWLLAQQPRAAAILDDAALVSDEAQLQNCLNEVLRLFPPVWSLARSARSEFRWNGERFPAGMVLLVSPWVQGRLASAWAQPNAFEPERWEALEPAPGLFLPFGLGRRACPGAAFAQQEIRIVLSLLLARFRFEAVAGRPTPAPLFGLTQRPRGGVWLRAWPR
jgi:cytochrome P450